MQQVFGILEQSAIYALLGLGVYISYNILKFPDLSVDGSFPFGAALCAVMLLGGVNSFLILPICFVTGMAVGFLTGIIHIKFKVRDLLSGILVMSALYSINLRIAGTSTLTLFSEKTIFSSSLANLLSPIFKDATTLLIAFIIIIFVKLMLDWFFETRLGFMLRAVGENESIVTSLGCDPGKIKVFGLMLSNGLVCLCGAVLCQYQRSFDVTMGTGKMVMGLAAVIIGLSVFAKLKRMQPSTKVMGGMIVYEAMIAIAISVGMRSSDLKFITAALFLFALSFDKVFKVKRREHNA